MSYTEEIINKTDWNKISIAHETLRSAQEVSIANSVLNSIDYRYEKPYQFNIIGHTSRILQISTKQEDKIAYLEHSASRKTAQQQYTAEQLKKYKVAINAVLLHRKHNTDLIYTFSSYNDGRPMLEHLKEQLIEHGFVLNQRSSQEVFEKIVNTEENKYILKLVNLICTFIQNFKTNGYTIDKFYEWESQTTNERTRLFLDVCQQC